MTLGKTLREAREAKGLTPVQLANATHILVQIISGIESEDFSRIPAQIYGRGFIRTICGVLKIDATPLLACFNDLWAHPEKRGMDIPFTPEPASIPTPSPSPVIPTVNTPPPVVPPPSATVTEPVGEPDLFSPRATTPPVITPIEESKNRKIENSPVLPTAPIEESKNRKFENSSAPAPRRQYGELFEYAETTPTAASGESALERFRSTLSTVSHSVVSTTGRLPRNFGRIVIISVISAILVGFMIWAIVFLYRATSALPTDTPKMERETTAAAPTAKPADNPKTKGANKTATAPARPPSDKPVKLRSTGDKVPPLYID